jgi:hypothetical protein
LLPSLDIFTIQFILLISILLSHLIANASRKIISNLYCHQMITLVKITITVIRKSNNDALIFDFETYDEPNRGTHKSHDLDDFEDNTF